MRILSFHPFSIFANGGGSRILRRLYNGHEAHITGLVVDGLTTTLPKGNIEEILVPAVPRHRNWMRWKLRNIVRWAREKVFRAATERRLQQAARGINYDVLHVVDHGPYAAALCLPEFYKDKALWVSFHDHFASSRSFENNSRRLWQNASRRLVISEEMGLEYSRLFGPALYEVITDGVKAIEIKPASTNISKPVTIYFAGLLHLHYIPLFETLANALDAIARQQGTIFKLVLRGTQQLDFLSNRQFEVDYRPLTLDNAQLKAELDAADILYLPIKFNSPDFYLYSLSTKMVGYLGAPGSILYHGPADAAACKLLEKWGAAVSCGSLQTDELSRALHQLLAGAEVSANAKKLAAEQFNMADIKARFWAE